MIKIFLFGVSGKMGRTIVESADGEGFAVAGGFDMVPHPSVRTFASVAEAAECDFDVIIDFSRAELLGKVCELAMLKHKPAVLASTGYDDADEARIRELAARVPVLRSGNMSVGVNLILELVRRAAETLYDSFDVEIVEKHHNQKADAPSGTALMLADEVRRVKTDTRLVYGRQGKAKREKRDVAIHAVRGGTIVGEHDVIFAGDDEIVTISHTALSRRIFAVGALKAAAFLVTASPALYSMRDALRPREEK